MQVAKMLRMGLVLVVGAVGATFAPPARGAADEAAKREAVLEARLEAEQALAGSALDARIDGKKVVLSGVVKSAEDKALAERVVKRAGYARVDNQVTVDPAVAPAPEAEAATDPGTERRALSDPERKDQMVGTRPFESTPTRQERLRSMGMEDPKLEKQRQEAAAKAKARQKDTTMTPTEAPPAGSDQAQTGNQSAPPAERKPESR